MKCVDKVKIKSIAEKWKLMRGDLSCVLPQVSVQQVISLLMGFVHASSARWAPTSQNQAGSSASPVEED